MKIPRYEKTRQERPDSAEWLRSAKRPKRRQRPAADPGESQRPGKGARQTKIEPADDQSIADHVTRLLDGRRIAFQIPVRIARRRPRLD